jgi:hypothetical protein
MVNRKENIINFAFTAAFVLFFMLLFSSFSDKHKSQSGRSRCEFRTEFRSDQLKAVVADNIEISTVQKSVETILLNTNFRLFSDDFKVAADNRKVAQVIISLRITHQSLHPIPICWVYHFFISKDSDELPILS